MAAGDVAMRNLARGLLLLLAALSLPASAQFASFQASTSPPSGTTTWAVLKVGAGGALTGIDIAPNGTKVVRTDTYGAWRFNPLTTNCGNASATGCWQQCVLSSSMPAADYGVGLGTGVYEIAIAPSSTARFYMIFNGYLYRTDDSCASWIRTAYAQVTAVANDNSTKGFGRYISVDPQNPDVVYASTPSSGLRVSNDAGATWSTVSAVGTATSAGTQGGGHVTWFDPTSGVSGGKKQGIYSSTYGTGVYHSTNGGTSWTLTSGGPTKHKHLVVDQNGLVWFTDDNGTNPNLWTYNGAWSHPIANAANNDRFVSIAIDPANAMNVYGGSDGGTLQFSLNGGSTWSGFTFAKTRTANDIPWLAVTNEDFFTNSDMAFDPSQSNKLYIAEGIGVWYTTPPTTLTTVAWISQSSAIEQLVGNMGISPPNGNPVLAFWDRPFFYIGSSVYPSNHGVNYVNGIQVGYSLDWASATPTFIVGISNFGGTDTSGFSSDGGQTWTEFVSKTPLSSGSSGGSIAASTTTNFIWVPSNNSNPYRTTNGGSSWSQISIAGVPTTGETGWGFLSNIDRQIVAADRVTANTFYLYNYGPTGSTAAEGVYRSTDSGANWTHMSNPGFVGNSFAAALRSVPGNAGHLFFSSGSDGSPHPANQLFYRSTDGGATWTAYANVKEVWAYGFGKAKPGGGGYPTVFIAGWLNGNWGIYRSDDADVGSPTWTQIGDGFPAGSFDTIKWLEGDANTYGTVYGVMNGSGAFKGTLNFLLDPENDNTPMWLEKVA